MTLVSLYDTPVASVTFVVCVQLAPNSDVSTAF